MADVITQPARLNVITNTTVTVTTSTDGLSNAADLKGHTLVGVYMPSAWTSADVSFSGSPDNATYYPVYDNTGTEVILDAVSTSVARYHKLDPADFAGLNYLKVRSGGSTGETAQGSARSVILALRHID